MVDEEDNRSPAEQAYDEVLENTFDTLWNQNAWNDPAVQEAIQNEEYERAGDLHEQAYDRLAEEAQLDAEHAAQAAYDSVSGDRD